MRVFKGMHIIFQAGFVRVNPDMNSVRELIIRSHFTAKKTRVQISAETTKIPIKFWNSRLLEYDKLTT
jgi:hypothetical protein